MLNCKYCGGPALPITEWAAGPSTADWWHKDREDCVAFLNARIAALEAELARVNKMLDKANAELAELLGPPDVAPCI